ncbi:hypothetical protein SAMN05216251_101341 [Actinacidiphila alni]|uniref:CAAX prenyl protease 2/Lysostaphin resistance protein A-like domain-containing protein n=1 Tax=Actinacidiphila alni TaxID=380248 RepID=A0A1I1XEP7_9ACTN|nr:CPBP family intramembrane glutamic endopeptidase [Actinacidiphila alni]SFE05884.1 hypothetical protein SAMN05216251_101341 [Actinacidiphila alni]
MTVTAGRKPLLASSADAGRQPGPLRAVLVAAVCLAVGQALGWWVVRETGLRSDSHGANAVFNVVAFAPTALLLVLWVTRWERRPFASLGFRGPRGLRRAVVGVITAIAGLLVLNLAVSAVGGGGDSGSGATATAVQAAFLLASFAVQAPTEELLFRGYLLPALGHRWGATGGVLFSSALFGAVHLVNAGATPQYALLTFLLGLCLAYWALADGSLWRPAAFHTVWNWAPSALSSGDTTENGNGAKGLDGPTVTAAALVLLLIAATALWSYRRARRRPMAAGADAVAPGH